MKRLLLLALALAGCATEKISGSDALGPELTVHTLPDGAEVLRDGRSLGLAPVTLPVKPRDTQFALEAHKGGYLPAKATLDAAGLRQAGGGDTWIALKPDTMGTDAPELDAMKAPDMDRAGVSLYKAKRNAEALAFFDRAVALDPNFAKARRDRAHCLVRLKRYDQAATDLEQYLTLGPNPDEVAKVQAQIDKLRAGHDFDLGEAKGAQ